MRGDEEAKTGERKERERGKRKNSREEEEGSNCALFLLEGIVGAQKNGGYFGRRDGSMLDRLLLPSLDGRAPPPHISQ